MSKLFLLIFGVITPLCIQDLEAGKTKVCKSEDAKEFVQRIPRERVSKTSIKEGFYQVSLPKKAIKCSQKEESYQNHHSKVAGKNPKEISVSTNIPNEETAESIFKIEGSKTSCVNTTKIAFQREELIKTLEKSISYLDKLVEIIRPVALKYWNEHENSYTGSELAVFSSDLKTTGNFINNCICFLSLNGGEGLGSLSAEDMGDWINKINEHLRELNERKILNINIEDHGTFIQTSAKKLQALWEVNTQK